MFFFDVVGGNSVQLLLLIKVENGLFFAIGIDFIHLFLKLANDFGWVYIFLLMWRLPLELFSGDERLFFVNFRFGFDGVFFEKYFLRALKIFVFEEIGHFGSFSTFGGIGLIVEEGPITFAVSFVDLLYSTNFIFE